ncbi:unnamed protein product [Parascedosporium putredinis]|uniref:Glucose-methanol-choline oxidoreductase N-terminal domain-containing protein n=1 Tax=Parascedosporium putredinis TaxID=1442378 RepID=A0A9P1M6S1_9PEZI|nr:unnamed protein product [Parascedosporium putredinis]CAI7988981.1 unnamed protein product [Parascedosporium putredinis]
MASSRALVLCGVLASLAHALPHSGGRVIKRQVEELRDSYDFVVVGGGTAGLTIADRLTEAFPDRNTLVIEYGVVEDAQAVFEPPGGGPGNTRLNIQSLPIPALNNRRASLTVGMTVGGSSTINGQFFDRGHKLDYDEWAKIGSPEFDDAAESWDWDNILPFFKKSVTFFEPSDENAENYGYTWDVDAAYGLNVSHIQAVYAQYQFPIQKIAWDAFVEMGLPTPTECAGGDKHGVCWVPASQYYIDGQRSHAGRGHYLEVVEDRSNYDLLVGHKPVGSTDEADIRTVTPNLEVVVSAGAIHSPQILQRSGVGESGFLESAGIDVVVDLPGVGHNFQDHCGPGSSFSLAESVQPSQGSVTSNATFGAEARELAIYLSLPVIAEDFAEIIDAIRAQVEDGSALDYLSEGTPESVRDGYLAQLSLLADSLENPEHPVLEAPWMSSTPGGGFLLKPLSRGTVMLDPEDHDAEPIVDYRTAANPIDLDVMSRFLPFFRRYYETDTMVALGPREVAPGSNVTEYADIIKYIRGNITPSFMHPCCTVAMMPKEKGGVVGPDLKVHGLDRVRVADISIIPLIPGTHTSATAYAIGEKAADIVIRAWAEEAEEPVEEAPKCKTKRSPRRLN